MNVSGTSTFNGASTFTNTLTASSSLIVKSGIVDGSGNPVGNGGKLLFATSTTATLSDPTSETNFYATTTIAANTLGSKGSLRIRSRINQNGGGTGTSGTCNWNVYLGTKQVANLPVTTVNGGTLGNSVMNVDIVADNSTSSVYAFVDGFDVFPTATATSTDTTVAQNLIFRGQRTGSTGCGNMIMYGVEVYGYSGN